ncbi:MAG TPA: hypothetical protein G4O12_09350 [Dehalococcoidia bacterium]|nr:hypothetical protein [Dehalococcoidia bacterium]
MQNMPEYERYPVSEAEMGQRYKNWVDALSRYTVIAFNVGKEVAGEKYVERVREEFYKAGQRSAKHWLEASGVKEAELADCRGLAKVQDFIDDGYANFWEGHIENSPRAFEKELLTCPVVKPWSRAPELCEIMLAASMDGLVKTLNPKCEAKGFSKLLTRGDKGCRFRVEMQE